MPHPFIIPPRASEALVAEELEQVGDAAGVAPLVVMPGHDLDEATQNSMFISRASSGVRPIARVTSIARGKSWDSL